MRRSDLSDLGIIVRLFVKLFAALIIATLLLPRAEAATAFLVKEHRPGHGDVICYYRTQDKMRKVITLPNGSECPATIEVD